MGIRSIKGNLILGMVAALIVLGCKQTINKPVSELLMTKAILEIFISNPDNDFYSNCLLQETLPIEFKKPENYKIVKENLELDVATFNKQIEASKFYSIPDSLFTNLNMVSLKKLTSVQKANEGKSVSDIYEDINCSEGLLCVTKPIFNEDKSRAFIQLYYKCPGICEMHAAYIMAFENNAWSIEQELEVQV